MPLGNHQSIHTTLHVHTTCVALEPALWLSSGTTVSTSWGTSLREVEDTKSGNENAPRQRPRAIQNNTTSEVSLLIIRSSVVFPLTGRDTLGTLTLFSNPFRYPLATNGLESLGPVFLLPEGA